jgi:hypothetical protein
MSGRGKTRHEGERRASVKRSTSMAPGKPRIPAHAPPSAQSPRGAARTRYSARRAPTGPRQRFRPCRRSGRATAAAERRSRGRQRSASCARACSARLAAAGTPCALAASGRSRPAGFLSGDFDVESKRSTNSPVADVSGVCGRRYLAGTGAREGQSARDRARQWRGGREHVKRGPVAPFLSPRPPSTIT